jgi:cbb3-type cytochrome c oxidase subunit II
MTPAVILVGVLLLLGSIALTMVYWPYAQQDTTPSDIYRARTEEENAGRRIYIANGCVYCHTQSIRTFDWDQGAERIAQPGDYVADEPVQLGSQRTGIDLSREGGEHPDDWHVAHFINPRSTRPSSIMPPFEWLGPERLRLLTRYVQGLGFKDADVRTARQAEWKEKSSRAYGEGPAANARWLAEQIPAGWRTVPNPYPTSNAALQRGHRVYQYFCIGCHGPIGDGMGPAQPHLYPPPLNFTLLNKREISGGILYYQIMNGITGTAMPYFKRDLESQKIWEVGDYVAYYFINQSDANTPPRGIDAAWEP